MFQKTVKKVPVLLKYDENNGYLCEDICACMTASH
jgi:hypothetical protein